VCSRNNRKWDPGHPSLSTRVRYLSGTAPLTRGFVADMRPCFHFRTVDAFHRHRG